MKNVLAVFALCAASAMAADVTGYIMDKSCSTKKDMLGDEACVKRCLGRGDAAVLVTEEGKVYSLSNQEKAKAYPGKKVTVTGKVEGDAITVDTIAPVKP